MTGASLSDSGDSRETNFGTYNCTQIYQSTIVRFMMTGDLCVLKGGATVLKVGGEFRERPHLSAYLEGHETEPHPPWGASAATG